MATTLRKIQNRLKSGRGLIGLTMEELRELTTATKLGPGVCAEISAKLKAAGVDHFPKELPVKHREYVYLFLAGSRPERIIRAFIFRSPEGIKMIQRCAA